MRLTSEFTVSSLIRRVFADGGFAAVERKGAEQAGAIFIRQRHRLGLQSLYGPAPQSFLEEEIPERLFERRLKEVEGEAVDAVLTRELRFDGDLWVLEIEAEDVARYISLAENDDQS